MAAEDETDGEEEDPKVLSARNASTFIALVLVAVFAIGGLAILAYVLVMMVSLSRWSDNK